VMWSKLQALLQPGPETEMPLSADDLACHFVAKTNCIQFYHAYNSMAVLTIHTFEWKQPWYGTPTGWMEGGDGPLRVG